MQWQWRSRQGNSRDSNNDAVAIVIAEQYLFAMVVDAAEKVESGTGLAQFWAMVNAEQLAKLVEPPSSDHVISVMQKNHSELRKQFLHGIASYCALLLHLQDRKAWVIHCGDCRLGSQQAGNVSWLSNIHTLANATGENFSQNDNANTDRHTLTRYLNARRFVLPDVQPVNCQTDHSWLLCSDGYWADHLGQNIPWGQLEDDASCLEISEKMINTEFSSDCENYLVYQG